MLNFMKENTQFPSKKKQKKKAETFKAWLVLLIGDNQVQFPLLRTKVLAEAAILSLLLEPWKVLTKFRAVNSLTCLLSNS